MKKVLSFIIYPIFRLLILIAKEPEQIVHDGYNWCEWQHVEYSAMNLCRMFVKFKEYRNLFYYRVGLPRHFLSWAFPGYDHLQITTPRGKIGGGLIIQHGFATIISASKIGENCKIYQQVTIGYNHVLKAPVLGDNVEVCCGAKIIGGVTIGNNVIIGANAVVNKNVPDNCVVAGIPAKIIKKL